jgi:hypothetical protein
MSGRRILILGGYGIFGGRLARLLADEPRLTLIIAGRSLEKASIFCRDLHALAQCQPLAFDREGDVESQLASAAPDIVVDASGPFQSYGDPYRLVRAAIANGINYLDLADGSDFVQGLAQFDEQAKSSGLFILSGVSSFPVLTAAVVRQLSHDMIRVEKITGGIAPSPYAGVGLNVIRAVASYAGKPISMCDGSTRVGLVDTRRYTIAPPGTVPLNPILFSLVDVPDLKVLPKLWPRLRDVWMGAGPVPEILHRALNLLGRIVNAGLLRSAAPLAPMMHRFINIFRWGENRGGMFVSVEGQSTGGRQIERSWHLVAEGDDGPLIPSMACEALIRRYLEGTPPQSGARAATNDLELADYDRLFAHRTIVTGMREQVDEREPLYCRLLGNAWKTLPPALQEMHDLRGTLIAEGKASVERGEGLFARIIGNVMRFPRAGDNVPVRVTFTRDGNREIWQRDFADKSFRSVIEQGRGRFERLQCERFGPLTFGLALVPDKGRLNLIARRWSAFGIPMPLFLMPRGQAYETATDGRFHFHVEIGHHWTGLIVRYRGWLVPRNA